MGFLSIKKVLGEIPDRVFCGMDEAGRGPWAGPVVACAMMFPKERIHLPGLRDSKQLTEKKRDQIYHLLQKKTRFGVGSASAGEIDRHGLIKATNIAYSRALEQLQNSRNKRPEQVRAKIDHILIDGRDKFDLPYNYTSIVKGDQKLKIIAAASVVAKVERDKIMKEMAKKYPQYGFAMHKGYGTRKHRQNLKKHGVSEIHRVTYKPVKECCHPVRC